MRLERFVAGVPLLLILTAALAWSQQQGDWIIGQERAAKRQIDAIGAQDRIQPTALRPDWQKARADADRLLALAQNIQAQLRAGAETVPADLAKELKEVQKLSKELHKDLLL